MAMTQNKALAVSPARERREAYACQYGSYENYTTKQWLVRTDKAIGPFRRKRKELGEHVDADELIEALGYRTPYWMNPWLLSRIPLPLIGSPENSDEWNDDGRGMNDRAKRPIGVSYEDYTSRGWPGNAGAPVRRVTRWEDAEIRRRLKTAGLTRPGAEVPTIGWTLAELIEKDEPMPGWIIEGILREGGAAMVYGPSGVGKTWLVHTFMLMAAAGHEVGVRNPLTGRWLLQAGKHSGVNVCLIDGEMISADISSRAKTLCKALGLRMTGSVQTVPPFEFDQLRLSLEKSVTPEQARAIAAKVCEREEAMQTTLEPVPSDDGAQGAFVDLTRIRVYPKASQDHRAEFVDLAGPEWKSRVVEFCRGHEIKVLILDNLSTLNETLEDENDATAWNPLNSLVVALKNEGVATILVHHSNKGEKGFRGSTNLATTLETIVALDRCEGAKATQGATFRLRFEKSRTHGQPEADGKTLKLDEDRWISEADPLSQAVRVVEMVNSMHYTKQQELADELGVDQATVSRAIDAAVTKGLAKEGELKEKLRQARMLKKRLAEPVPPEVEEDDDAELDI